MITNMSWQCQIMDRTEQKCEFKVSTAWYQGVILGIMSSV